MNTIRDYVSKLPDTEKKVIIESFERFEVAGFVGDEPIRQHAEIVSHLMGIRNTSSIVVWMNFLALECYRYFAHVYLSGI